MKRLIIGAAVLALATIGAACGSSDISEDTFRDALVEHADFTEAEAECITDASFEQFDQSEINELYTAADEADLEGTAAEDFQAIVQECAEPDTGS